MWFWTVKDTVKRVSLCFPLEPTNFSDVIRDSGDRWVQKMIFLQRNSFQQRQMDAYLFCMSFAAQSLIFYPYTSCHSNNPLLNWISREAWQLGVLRSTSQNSFLMDKKENYGVLFFPAWTINEITIHKLISKRQCCYEIPSVWIYWPFPEGTDQPQ